MPHAQVECERFLNACRRLVLYADLPDDIALHLKPVTQAYLETCQAALPEDDAQYHIYTDGSSYIHHEDDCFEREGTWAAVVFKVVGTMRTFVGWTGGFVVVDPTSKAFLGARDCHAMQAERTAIFWIMAWALVSSSMSTINQHVLVLLAVGPTTRQTPLLPRTDT